MISHWNHSKQFKIALSLLLATTGIFLLVIMLGNTRSLAYHFVWALALAAASAANYGFFCQNNARSKRIYALLGFLFVFSQALGYRLKVADYSGWSGILLCAGIGFGFAPGAAYLLLRLVSALDAFSLRESPKKALSPTKVFWGSFGIIFVCWIPVFLAYYPGLFAYDVNRQITEMITGQLTNYNPILHTLYIGAFYLLGGILGSYNTAIAISVILQMMLLAASLAWLIRYMVQLKSAPAFCIFTLVGFALLPIHSMLAISCTKDTLFSAAMLLYSIRLHQLSRNGDLLSNRKWVILTVLVVAVICLLRNNAIFGIAVSIPLGILVVGKHQKFRMMAMVLAGVLLFMIVGQGLRVITNAEGINNVELVSIPSQQMARVYNLHHEDYAPSQEIEAYLPTASYYYPFTADAVKTFAQIKEPGQMWGFIKLWGKVGLQFPFEYLDAFLLTTQGYWWLDDTTHAAIYGEGLDGRQGYLLTDTKEGFGISHTSYFKPLEALLERLFSANEYQTLPVISLLFTPSLYLWLTVFGLFRAIERSRRDFIVVCGFLLCYMIPLWFGACVLIRYAYPLVVCLPLHLFTHPHDALNE